MGGTARLLNHSAGPHPIDFPSPPTTLRVGVRHVRVHGGPTIRAHGRSGCLGARSMGCCVRPRCLSLLPEASWARHVPSQCGNAGYKRFLTRMSHSDLYLARAAYRDKWTKSHQSTEIAGVPRWKAPFCPWNYNVFAEVAKPLHFQGDGNPECGRGTRATSCCQGCQDVEDFPRWQRVTRTGTLLQRAFTSGWPGRSRMPYPPPTCPLPPRSQS